MNLLFLTYQGDVSGATNSIFYLTRGLADLGHQVYVGCRPDSLLYGFLEGTKVQRIPMHFKGKFDCNNWREIRDAVQQHNIQLINAQSSKDRYTSAFAKWRYGLGVKIIHTRRQTPKSMGGFLQNWFYTTATEKIVAVSEGVKQELVRLGLSANHIEVIYNGTPRNKYQLTQPEKTQFFKEKYHIQEGETVIGCVARYKQQEQLLAALHHVEKPLTLLLVGIKECADYQEITKTYKLPHRVIYTGEVSAEDVLYHYGLMQVKVLPSVIEGLSQSLLEAMALGVPVLATAFAGNLDLIQDGENGFLFENKNSKQLAQKLTQLIEDESLRAKFSTAGKHTALETFSIEKTVKNYERFFESLL